MENGGCPQLFSLIFYASPGFIFIYNIFPGFGTIPIFNLFIESDIYSWLASMMLTTIFMPSVKDSPLGTGIAYEKNLRN